MKSKSLKALYHKSNKTTIGGFYLSIFEGAAFGAACHHNMFFSVGVIEKAGHQVTFLHGNMLVAHWAFSF